jgi:cytosine/adenosine deaminase-related metal-dependent hydrolase
MWSSVNERNRNTPRPTLYRAPYVVPVATPVIQDGGVLVQGGRIVAVDQFRRLRPEAGQVVELDGRVITPALINCHCHLELSHLAPLGREASLPPGDITAWIRCLLARRCEENDAEQIRAAARQGLARLYQRGVALVADIGNRQESQQLGQDSGTEQLFFHEVLGLTESAAAAALASLIPGLAATVHSPYSCHPRLIRAVKGEACRLSTLFPIHVAESPEEIEFLLTGSGPMREFLAERLEQVGALAVGQSVNAMIPPPPGQGAVAYLAALGVLDSRTICVHAVHLTLSEVELIARTQAKVCLCPGSNRRLGVGKAPLPLMIEHQLLPGLGTDSLASNGDLDLWQEMQCLHADHPGLDPELIFRMATQGGAETLGVASRLGALAPLRQAKILSVAYSGAKHELYPFLVDSGQAIATEWLEADHEE